MRAFTAYSHARDHEKVALAARAVERGGAWCVWVLSVSVGFISFVRFKLACL